MAYGLHKGPIIKLKDWVKFGPFSRKFGPFSTNNLTKYLMSNREWKMGQIFVDFWKYSKFNTSQLNSCTVLKKVCTETIYPLQMDLNLHSAVFERCQISLSLTSFERLEKSFQVFKYFEGHVFSLQPLAFLYSCNNITTTLIQISRLFYFGFFSKTNHQMMI